MLFKTLVTIFLLAQFSTCFDNFCESKVKKLSCPKNITGEWEIKLKAGNDLELKFDSNPTTGYNWFIEDVSTINKEICLPANLNKYNSSDDYAQNKLEKGVVGVGGVITFKFNAKGKGVSKIRFVYKRSWENTPIQTVIAKVTVTPQCFFSCC